MNRLNSTKSSHPINNNYPSRFNIYKPKTIFTFFGMSKK
jgi:hypothetical protein